MLTDILHSGTLPRDVATWRAEALVHHRVKVRLFIVNRIPPDSVGAELGVFTGLFSGVLARQKRVRRIAFVDPWWLAYGDHYPAWGKYTANGALSTRAAHELASRRVARFGLPDRTVEVAFSEDWLAKQADHSLDWVYLDSTHSYEGTKGELNLLDAKIKPEGIILGDDWHQDPNHRHHGVYRAVNEFVRHSDFEIIFCGVANQWALRRRTSDRSDKLAP